MKVIGTSIRISTFKVIVTVSVALLVLLGYLFFRHSAEPNIKLDTIVGGVLAGLVIAVAQLFLSWYEYKTIDKFESMLIFDVRTNRDSRIFYQNIIAASQKEIYIMGVTADRFIEHFADIESNQQNSRVLLEAMSQRKVKVRILLPSPNFLDKQNLKVTSEQVRLLLINLKASYPNNFDFRYFAHTPTHSIFVVDDKCILGPVFPKLSSKDTPAIYLAKQSAFAEPYLVYFNNEWNSAQ